MKNFKKLKLKLKEKYFGYKYRDAPVGSLDWLIKTEIKYGGLVVDVDRNKVGSKDVRTPEELKRGGMVGGDRMSDLYHGYGKHYEKYLRPFVSRDKKVVLAEVGILKGSGLAIWSELFPLGRIIGLDIDLNHIKNNMDYLKKNGAFKNNNLTLNEFDQFENNTALLREVLGGDEIDIFIDDGLHSEESILSTIESVLPCLSSDFVYIIEDNDNVFNVINNLYKDRFIVTSLDELTVMTPKHA